MHSLIRIHYFPTASLKPSIRPFFLKLLKKSHPHILYYDKPFENLHSRLSQDIYFDDKKYSPELKLRFNNNEFYFSTHYPIFYHVKKMHLSFPKIWRYGRNKIKVFISDVMEKNQNLIFLFMLYVITLNQKKNIYYTHIILLKTELSDKSGLIWIFQRSVEWHFQDSSTNNTFFLPLLSRLILQKIKWAWDSRWMESGGKWS